jgi:hypothetical protein
MEKYRGNWQKKAEIILTRNLLLSVSRLARSTALWVARRSAVLARRDERLTGCGWGAGGDCVWDCAEALGASELSELAVGIDMEDSPKG